MFLILPFVYACGNAYINARALQAMPTLPLWVKVLVSVVYWLLALSLIISFTAKDLMPDWLKHTTYVLGAVWLVFTLYMVMALALTDIVKILLPTLKGGFWWALGITMSILIYGYCNYCHPVVNKIEIALNKPISRPLRMVVVSDVHLGYATGKKQLGKYVELINAQQPDVVLILGDLIDNDVTPVRVNHMEEELNKIRAAQGVYMVPGNHEYISGIHEVEQFLHSTHIVMLRDSVITLSNGVQIVGRDDRHHKRRLPLADIVKKADSSQPIVMLDHQPYKIAKKDSLGVDVQLSGHTHRGQVFPMNLLVDAMYEQSHGYKKWPHSHVYVSCGLSLWGPPFRIGTNSDIAVITLR